MFFDIVWSARSRRDAMETMVPFLLLVLNLDAKCTDCIWLGLGWLEAQTLVYVDGLKKYVQSSKMFKGPF